MEAPAPRGERRHRGIILIYVASRTAQASPARPPPIPEIGPVAGRCRAARRGGFALFSGPAPDGRHRPGQCRRNCLAGRRFRPPGSCSRTIQSRGGSPDIMLRPGGLRFKPGRADQGGGARRSHLAGEPFAEYQRKRPFFPAHSAADGRPADHYCHQLVPFAPGMALLPPLCGRFNHLFASLLREPPKISLATPVDSRAG